jgi:putative PIN family toxin of toxin-antitoxin system
MHPGSRIVMDTNVLISAVLFFDSVAERVLTIIEDHHVLLASKDTMKELAEVLSRPKFAAYISDGQAADFIARVHNTIEFISIIHRIAACRDPEDDKILDVAVNGDAHCIITGDRDLLELNPFRGISILTPLNFIQTQALTQ